MARVVELIIIANALGGGAAYLFRRYTKRRKERNVDHVRELHTENQEIDRMLDEMKSPSERRQLRGR